METIREFFARKIEELRPSRCGTRKKTKGVVVNGRKKQRKLAS
jgi:hypothetical protein